ncbi:MAG TPA: peptidoglycan-associated lipoprotein Pal [Nitrospiria bacterium]
MQKLKSMQFIVIAGIGAVLLLSGCPKKTQPVKATAVTEEKVKPAEEAPAPAPAPVIVETPVSKPVELPPPADIHFDYDKYTIRSEDRPSLEATVRWLTANPGSKLKIEGNCDERGTNEYNLALGERRAKAVKSFLTAMGVDASRLSTISYGEERPVCSDSSESCFAKNRRAHFSVQ